MGEVCLRGWRCLRTLAIYSLELCWLLMMIRGSLVRRSVAVIIGRYSNKGSTVEHSGGRSLASKFYLSIYFSFLYLTWTTPVLLMILEAPPSMFFVLQKGFCTASTAPLCSSKDFFPLKWLGTDEFSPCLKFSIKQFIPGCQYPLKDKREISVMVVTSILHKQTTLIHAHWHSVSPPLPSTTNALHLHSIPSPHHPDPYTPLTPLHHGFPLPISLHLLVIAP